MKYILFLLSALGTTGSGALLHYQYTTKDLVPIMFASGTCICLIVTSFFACRAWYLEGKIDALKELRRQLSDS